MLIGSILLMLMVIWIIEGFFLHALYRLIPNFNSIPCNGHIPQHFSRYGLSRTPVKKVISILYSAESLQYLRIQPPLFSWLLLNILLLMLILKYLQYQRYTLCYNYKVWARYQINFSIHLGCVRSQILGTRSGWQNGAKKVPHGCVTRILQGNKRWILQD